MLCGCSGPTIVPRCLPSDEIIQSPPGPDTYRFPFASIFMPSSASSPCAFVMSKNTLPFERAPSALTSYRMTIFFLSSQLSTYRYFSSGENAKPLGPFNSVVSNWTCFPSGDTRNTPLNGNSFRGSSKNFGSPNGGSVKYSDPSDL